jgi:hypothetical protein
MLIDQRKDTEDSAPGMTNTSHAVFLSYNGEDRAAVEEIAIYLADKASLHPWFDQWALIPGEPWVRNLERGLANPPPVPYLSVKAGKDPGDIRGRGSLA